MYDIKGYMMQEDKDCVFEFVEDDVEMNAVFKIFEELLEDVDIER